MEQEQPRIPTSLREAWPVYLLTLLALLGTIAGWYALSLHNRTFDLNLSFLGAGNVEFRGTWFQPVVMIALAVLFFLLLRLFTGRGWKDLTSESRVVVVSCLGLFGLLWLFGRVGFFQRNLAQYFPETAFTPLYGFFYFSFNCVLARTIIPVLIIRTRLRGRAVDYGYRFRGTFELWWVYLGLGLAVALVVVFYASTLQPFLDKYPMCRAMIRGDEIQWWHFVLYQLAYGAIFVSGESFWRGYISFGLERDLGKLALVFMVVPYVTAHFGKPWSETVGAIATGLVLGYLALRHRSFWLGVAAHWGVAMTMDIAAIIRRGIRLV